MRYWQAILPTMAAAGLSAPALAAGEIYVPVAYTDEVVVVIQMKGAIPPQARRTARASQVAYYATPNFNYEGVPVRYTETEFEIDCESGQGRRLHAAAFRDAGEQLGEDSYTDPWGPMPDGTHLGDMRRMACDGLAEYDKVYTNLASAVGAHRKMVRDASAE